TSIHIVQELLERRVSLRERWDSARGVAVEIGQRLREGPRSRTNLLPKVHHKHLQPVLFVLRLFKFDRELRIERPKNDTGSLRTVSLRCVVVQSQLFEEQERNETQRAALRCRSRNTAEERSGLRGTCSGTSLRLPWNISRGAAQIRCRCGGTRKVGMRRSLR